MVRSWRGSEDGGTKSCQLSAEDRKAGRWKTFSKAGEEQVHLKGKRKQPPDSERTKTKKQRESKARAGKGYKTWDIKKVMRLQNIESKQVEDDVVRCFVICLNYMKGWKRTQVLLDCGSKFLYQENLTAFPVFNAFRSGSIMHIEELVRQWPASL